MKLTIAALLAASLFAVGCADHKEDMGTTAPNVTPNYEAGHYNPAVNSTGSGVGRDDPAINSNSLNATGTGTGTPAAPPRMSGPSGTSDQNAGSSSPSGATGNSAAGQ